MLQVLQARTTPHSLPEVIDRATAARATDVKPKVLFVGVGQPWERRAGYLVRQDMFLQALSECARLHLAMFHVVEDQATSPYGAPITALQSPSVNTSSAWREEALDLLSRIPVHYRRLHMEAPRSRVRELLSQQFNAVFAYRIDFAWYAGVLEHPRLLLDIDDPEHLRRRQRDALNRAGELPGGNGKGDWFSTYDLHRLERFERRAVRKAAAAFVCQAADQKAFDDPKPLIVPNCVETPDSLPPRAAAEPCILFVGNLAAAPDAPNTDGVLWFVREVWPRVLQRVPQCRFRIVGPIESGIAAQLAAHPNVEIAGFVEHLGPAMQSASLTIAPIRFGTGTRMKILESMAWGCPVVSTTKGCEGLEVTPGEDILIDDEPNAMAESCVRLLKDPELQQSLGRRGYALVIGNYDRRRRHRNLVQMLDELLRRAGAPRR